MAEPPNGLPGKFSRQALRLGAHDYLAKDQAVGEPLVLAVRRAAERCRLRTENALLLEELHRRSLTDALTGVGNRRAFDAALEQEVARAGRTSSPFGVVMVDIDHFKSINDRLGHTAGDEVLAAFAARVSAAIRGADRLFRYGGEEFAVIAPSTSLQGTLTLARRIVSAVAAAPFCAEGAMLPITCSAGASVSGPGGDEPGRAIVVRADTALYEAKGTGRNRARSSGAPGAPSPV